MQVIEIDDRLALKAQAAASAENKSLNELVNLALLEIIARQEKNAADAESVNQFAESYRKMPQTKDEIEIWDEVEAWGEE